MAVAWNHHEGYDIHVLRGGSASKSLAAAARIFNGGIPGKLKFVADFGGAPDNLDVRVNEATGEVRAFFLRSIRRRSSCTTSCCTPR